MYRMLSQQLLRLSREVKESKLCKDWERKDLEKEERPFIALGDLALNHRTQYEVLARTQVV